MALVIPLKRKDYLAIDDRLFFTKKTFIHLNNWINRDWINQHRLLQENAASMIILNDSLVLDQRLSSDTPLYDGAGKLVAQEEKQHIFNEKYERITPRRGENIDALFELQGGHRFSKVWNLYLSQDHIYSEDKGLNPSYSELLDPDTLMEDRGIDLVHYIKEAHTSQGLPRKDVKEGNFSYQYPRDGCFARFFADSDEVDLYCDGYPDDLNCSFGGRAKIFTENLKQFLEELRDKYKVSKK